MTQQHTVQAALDPRLLRELPRFFGGTVPILREVIQNAVRAGATMLWITHSGDVLTFTDNGRGLDDPQLLLSVARTGWGESVQHPAGMGVLSTLSSDFSTHVAFSSRDWGFGLTFEDFASQTPIEVTGQSPQQGFTLRATLAVVPKNIQELIQTARARAPLTVQYNGAVIPPMTLDGATFELEWGTVILDTKRDTNLNGAVHSSGVVFWEGFPIGLDVRRRLSDLAQAATENRRVTLVPRPHSGISPKLPDRSTINEDAGLTAALNDVSEAIERRVIQNLEGVDLSAPVIGEIWAHRRSAAAKARTDRLETWCDHPKKVLQTVLESLGYLKTSTYPLNFTVNLAMDDDDDTCYGQDTLMVQSRLAVTASGGDCAALDLLRPDFPGLPLGALSAALARDLEDLTDTAEHPADSDSTRTATTADGEIRLVQSVTVGGVAVPWFISGNGVVLAADREHALDVFDRWSEHIGTALLAQLWASQTIREVYGDETGSLSGRTCAADLRAGLIRNY